MADFHRAQNPEALLVGPCRYPWQASSHVTKPEAVGAAVGEAVAHFAGCPIRDFVPLLVERASTAKLGALLEA